MITKDFLLEHFKYENGELYWRLYDGFGSVYYLKAGHLRKNKYTTISINKKKYALHRLIFMMHHGYLPEKVDHIDCNPLNNKIENLRAATSSENQYNRRLNKNNTSGYKSVYWHKRESKWRVQMKINNKLKYFGSYKDLDLAILVAQEARNKYHKEFARHD